MITFGTLRQRQSQGDRWLPVCIPFTEHPLPQSFTLSLHLVISLRLAIYLVLDGCELRTGRKPLPPQSARFRESASIKRPRVGGNEDTTPSRHQFSPPQSVRRGHERAVFPPPDSLRASEDQGNKVGPVLRRDNSYRDGYEGSRDDNSERRVQPPVNHALDPVIDVDRSESIPVSRVPSSRSAHEPTAGRQYADRSYIIDDSRLSDRNRRPHSLQRAASSYDSAPPRSSSPGNSRAGGVPPTALVPADLHRDSNPSGDRWRDELSGHPPAHSDRVRWITRLRFVCARSNPLSVSIYETAGEGMSNRNIPLEPVVCPLRLQEPIVFPLAVEINRQEGHLHLHQPATMELIMGMPMHGTMHLLIPRRTVTDTIAQLVVEIRAIQPRTKTFYRPIHQTQITKPTGSTTDRSLCVNILHQYVRPLEHVALFDTPPSLARERPHRPRHRILRKDQGLETIHP